MARLSARTARHLRWSALPAALLVSSLVVAQGSYSAFTATTANPGNSWESGSIVLTNSSPQTAMFSVNDIKPGDWDSKCITVTAEKFVAGTTVKMRLQTAAGSPGASQELSSSIFMKVSMPDDTCAPSKGPIATNGTVGSGTPLNTVINFNPIPNTQWMPTNAVKAKQYLIEWVFNPAAGSEAANQSTRMDFVWQATQGAGQKVGG